MNFYRLLFYSVCLVQSIGLRPGLLMANDSVAEFEVRKVFSKRRVVLIRGKETLQLKTGQKICFRDAEGNIKSCGRVKRLFKKTPVAVIAFDTKDEFSKVDKSMLAFVAVETEEPPSSLATKALSSGVGMRLMYGMVRSPSTFDYLIYSAQEDGTEENGNRFEAVEKVSAIFGVPGAEFFYNDYSLGLRAQTHTDVTAEANVELGSERFDKRYYEVRQAASVFAVWTDYRYLSFVATDGLVGNLTAGIDFEKSDVKFAMNRRDADGIGDNATVLDVVSTLHSVSIRLGANINSRIWLAESSTGIDLIIPTFSRQSKGGIVDLEIDGIEDQFYDALNHSTNFGFVAGLRIGIVF